MYSEADPPGVTVASQPLLSHAAGRWKKQWLQMKRPDDFADCDGLGSFMRQFFLFLVYCAKMQGTLCSLLSSQGQTALGDDLILN